MPVRSTYKYRIQAVEQTRQQMQAATAREDYILAGKLQEVLAKLVTVGEQMQQAAQQDDFILAGKLQAQLNTFSESVAKKNDLRNDSPHPQTVSFGVWGRGGRGRGDQDRDERGRDGPGWDGGGHGGRGRQGVNVGGGHFLVRGTF